MDKPKPDDAALSPGYVLVVEDSDLMRHEIEQILRNAGVVCEGLASGQEAIAKARSGNPPELMVLDYMLTDMTGAEVVETLRRSGHTVPFIVTTGHGDERVAVQMMKAGASDYLVKSPSLMELLPSVVNRVREGVHVGRRLEEAEEERRHLQAEIERIRVLEEAAKQLREDTAQLVQTEKLIALGQLAACVAHELNQPLNAANMAIQTIVRYPEETSAEAVRSELQEVLVLFSTMAEIVDHMRVFSRSADDSAWRASDLNDILDRALRFVQQELKIKGIDLVKQLAPDLPKPVVNPTGIEQVILNLLVNARDAAVASNKNGKTIGVESRAVRSDSDRSARSVVVRVWDNGPGVPEEIREDLFLPFFTTKEPGKGTGLGLAVASHIIGEHRGSLKLTQSSDQGSTFEITLPIR